VTEAPEQSELALRARAGDPEAWEALYRAHEPALYTYVYHRVQRDRALADDVFHDAFLKAVERIASFDPERGSFGAWLTGIARNELRQRVRSQLKGKRVALPDELPADEPAPRDVGEGVNLAFSQLSAGHQRVLALKYQQGQSLEAIARTLESTPAAVGSLLHRARAAFRQAYGRLASGGAQ